MPGEGSSPRCHHCNDRIGVYEPVCVVDSDGQAVAVSSYELHTAPQREWLESPMLHFACAQDTGYAVAAR
jgi:hypothetical protein